jgi:hypothetical protein
VHRVFAVDITADTWRFWNDAPGFSQRFTHTLSDDNAINGQGELSLDDGATWEHDLAITYRRILAKDGQPDHRIPAHLV